MNQRYNEIYNKEIIQASNGVIFTFNPVEDKFTYRPFSHATTSDAVEKLSELMRHNLLFYAYGEDEVVQHYEKDHFNTLDQAAKYAYKNRLPKRADTNDGLPSEVLLDLLIQMYNSSAYKLAVRTIYRQNDNNEIKGYDLTYFSIDSSGISLWLGQAKLGKKNYCIKGIYGDLLEKFSKDYLSKQLFFLCDKRTFINEEAKQLLENIDNINICSMEDDTTERAHKLLCYFKEENIKVKIPCLLAYEEENVYKDVSQLYFKIQSETESIREYFTNNTYMFDGFSPDIVFYIFPIESIIRLRNKENGFYAGLY